MPDNDLTVLPSAIANLINLRELDVSKNSKQGFSLYLLLFLRSRAEVRSSLTKQVRQIEPGLGSSCYNLKTDHDVTCRLSNQCKSVWHSPQKQSCFIITLQFGVHPKFSEVKCLNKFSLLNGVTLCVSKQVHACSSK